MTLRTIATLAFAVLLAGCGERTFCFGNEDPQEFADCLQREFGDRKMTGLSRRDGITDEIHWWEALWGWDDE